MRTQLLLVESTAATKVNVTTGTDESISFDVHAAAPAVNPSVHHVEGDTIAKLILIIPHLSPRPFKGETATKAVLVLKNIIVIVAPTSHIIAATCLEDVSSTMRASAQGLLPWAHGRMRCQGLTARSLDKRLRLLLRLQGPPILQHVLTATARVLWCSTAEAKSEVAIVAMGVLL